MPADQKKEISTNAARGGLTVVVGSFRLPSKSTFDG
jgi:hypothetical protein